MQILVILSRSPANYCLHKVIPIILYQYHAKISQVKYPSSTSSQMAYNLHFHDGAIS